MDALDEHGFLLSEYEWVRGQTVAALWYGAYASFDLQELVTAAEQGRDPIEPTAVNVPQANAELVDAHRDELEDLIGFAYVGL